jgi:hypothetical protein
MDQDIYVIFAGIALSSFILENTPHTKIKDFILDCNHRMPDPA